MKAAIIFIVAVIICTFSANTIYYFTLPKVSVQPPVASVFSEVETMSGGIIRVRGQQSFRLDLPFSLKVAEVLVSKGDEIFAETEILRFDAENLEKQLTALEKQVESANIALSEFRRGFNNRVNTLREQIPSGMSGGEVAVTAPHSGVVTMFYSRGSSVMAGAKVAEISDNSKFILKIPFSVSLGVCVGMAAEVSIPSVMTTLSGKVTALGGEVTLYGAKARMVTIELENPGALEAGELASATLEGGLTPVEGGVLEYIRVSAITAESSGEITEAAVTSGETVSAGTRILRIKLPSAQSARDELEYMQTTGIYNGRTEKQLADTLAEAQATLEKLENLTESGVLLAGCEGVITSLSVADDGTFSGGTVFDFAPKSSGYEAVFQTTARVTPGMSCKVYGVSGARQISANAKVDTVENGVVTLTSNALSSLSGAINIYAEVTVSETPAPISVPVGAMATSNSVYVVTSRKGILGEKYIVTRTEVSTGASDAWNVEITSGLTLQDTVIVAWDRAVMDGDTVDIVSGLLK